MLKKALSIILALAPLAVAQGTLEVWIMPNSAQPAEDFKALVAPFEKARGVQVKVTVLDWGVAWTKITTAATSGVGPDLTQLGTTWWGRSAPWVSWSPWTTCWRPWAGRGLTSPPCGAPPGWREGGRPRPSPGSRSSGPSTTAPMP